MTHRRDTGLIDFASPFLLRYSGLRISGETLVLSFFK
jgi:hypothetical protein